MKKNKLNQYEAQTSLEPSPEQIQQAKEWAVNRMMEVVDKLPANPAPVAESFEELARQAKFGVLRQPTQIISAGNTEIILTGSDVPRNATLHNSGDAESTETNSGKTTFTDIEIELLRRIQENAE
jgi:hypothetical protein